MLRFGVRRLPWYDALQPERGFYDVNGLPFVAATDTGVRIAVRLTPRAARNDVDGISTSPGGRVVLRLRVAAPPMEGAANAALVDYVARSLRLRKVDIIITSGERGRTKLLELSGDPTILLARLREWADEGRRT